MDQSFGRPFIPGFAGRGCLNPLTFGEFRGRDDPLGDRHAGHGGSRNALDAILNQVQRGEFRQRFSVEQFEEVRVLPHVADVVAARIVRVLVVERAAKADAQDLWNALASIGRIVKRDQRIGRPLVTSDVVGGG